MTQHTRHTFSTAVRAFGRRTLVSTLTIACLAAMSLPAFGQQFHSNDVTPPNSTAAKLTGASSGTQVGGGSNGHAVLLTGNALSSVDLNPTGYYSSMATSADDVQQCGYGYSNLGTHAVLWSGSAASSVDLHPSGYMFSYCTGVQNGQQVGFAENMVYFLTLSHALLWNGSAAVVDLHPTALPYNFSRAMGVHDGEQVGYVSSFAYPYGDSIGYHIASHAVRWTGTAASAVDIHPAGYDASEALATNGLQEGGWAYMAAGPTMHAMLWYGTAGNFVDLHPAGFTDSKITALTATQQVGEGWVGTPFYPDSVRHALVWSGTADSVVDLNQYLPASYTNAVATGIDPNGNVVGYAYNSYVQGPGVPPDAIAVIFAPGQAPASALSSITLTPSNVAPGTDVQGVVSLGGPAQVGGVNISFLSTATSLVATPASIVIPEGASSAAFVLPTGGTALTAPSALKIYASDGTVSQAASLTLTPVVNLSTVTVNAVEGGFSTYGTLTLSIPAQAGGAVVALTSSNPALVTVPAAVTIPQGYTSASFIANTAAVAAITAVPVTATMNGQTLSANVSLNPAPVVALANFSVFPTVVGGQSIAVTVNMTNFPRNVEGAVVTLSSGDVGTLQVPATVTVPQGAFSATFIATTVVVPGIKGVSVKAVYNGTNITTTIMVNPIPTVAITTAEYLTDLQLFKVQASTTYANSILTYGTDPTSPPLGTMQFELGAWKGSMLMATAPAFATVWNSNGGSATVAVVVRTSGGGGVAAGGGGGGAAGGGGGTSSTYKISIGKTGKGTVTANPSAASYVAGTVVTLTATPDPGAPWIGWAGACTGAASTCTLTMTSNMSVTANFK
jgi:hypothetical protein